MESVAAGDDRCLRPFSRSLRTFMLVVGCRLCSQTSKQKLVLIGDGGEEPERSRRRGVMCARRRPKFKARRLVIFRSSAGRRHRCRPTVSLVFYASDIQILVRFGVWTRVAARYGVLKTSNSAAKTNVVVCYITRN